MKKRERFCYPSGPFLAGPCRLGLDAGRRQQLGAAKLAQMPKITTNNLLSGTFMSDFESYTRTTSLAQRLPAAGNPSSIILSSGSWTTTASPWRATRPSSWNIPGSGRVSHALKCFQSLYDAYLQDSTVYFALVPDKAYYLAAGERLSGHGHESRRPKSPTELPGPPTST